MSLTLDQDGPDLNPRNIAPDCWYYETVAGLEVYYEGRLVCILKWRSIEASLKRKKAGRKK